MVTAFQVPPFERGQHKGLVYFLLCSSTTIQPLRPRFQWRAGMGRGEGARSATPRARGPRGGTTTISESGMVRKNLWISWEENEALRSKAFADRRSETSVMRQGLRQTLGLTEDG